MKKSTLRHSISKVEELANNYDKHKIREPLGTRMFGNCEMTINFCLISNYQNLDCIFSLNEQFHKHQY